MLDTGQKKTNNCLIQAWISFCFHKHTVSLLHLQDWRSAPVAEIWCVCEPDKEWVIRAFLQPKAWLHILCCSLHLSGRDSPQTLLWVKLSQEIQVEALISYSINMFSCMHLVLTSFCNGDILRYFIFIWCCKQPQSFFKVMHIIQMRLK